MSINREREERINKFLKLIVEKSKKQKITDANVYNELIKFEIPKENIKKVEHLYNNWVNRYINKANTTAFVKKSISDFCYIMTPSVKYGFGPIEEPIKLYISLPEEYLVEGVNQIMDYLDKEGIVHQSKVASIVRADNVVMRIYKKEDAEKVIQFINNNEFIKEHHQNVNPFCITTGVIGLAMDNYNSYNSTVSFLISKYINEKKEQNKLEEVVYEDFLEFVEKFKINRNTTIQSNGEEKQITKEEVVFLSEIKKLIKISLKSNNRKNVYNHYYKVYKNLHLNGNKIMEETDIIKIIESCVLMTEEKYGYKTAIEAMCLYLLCGNKQGITKETTHGDPCRMLLNLVDHNIAREIVKSYDGKKKIIIELQNYFNSRNKKIK